VTTTATTTELREGDPAPEFTTTTDEGVRVSLRDFRGKPVVLYFYPKDDTPGCTIEACEFRDSHPRFVTRSAVVLGVSPDSTASHQKFKRKFDLPFTLLADEPEDDGTPRVCEMYGVWQEKSMYGRKYIGVVRTTYLIDSQGKVARRWDSVKVPGHADEVLAAINVLK
jgi:thioredoxin-dependent peroxiredoxin